MRCPTCAKEGREHTVSPGMVSTTLLSGGSGHWNERDEWVSPPIVNTRTSTYYCSNGHTFSVQEPTP